MATLANQTLNSEGFFLAAIGIGADLDEVCNQYKLPHFNSNHAFGAQHMYMNCHGPIWELSLLVSL